MRGNWSDQDRGSTVRAKELPIDLAGSSLGDGAEQILLTHLGQAIYNPFFRYISVFLRFYWHFFFLAFLY